MYATVTVCAFGGTRCISTTSEQPAVFDVDPPLLLGATLTTSTQPYPALDLAAPLQCSWSDVIDLGTGLASVTVCFGTLPGAL